MLWMYRESDMILPSVYLYENMKSQERQRFNYIPIYTEKLKIILIEYCHGLVWHELHYLLIIKECSLNVYTMTTNQSR